MKGDWIVDALIGLDNDPQQAADIAGVFRYVRTAPEPDAFQVFLAVVKQTVMQAQESFQDAVRADPDLTPEQKAKWLAAHRS